MSMTDLTTWTSISIRLRAASNVDLAQLFVLAGLAFLASLPFRATFDSWSYVVPYGFAVFLCACIWVGLTTASQRFLNSAATLSTRLPVMLLALCLLGWVVTQRGGSPVAFWNGLVEGWADLLASPAPIELTSRLEIPVFVLGWLAMYLGLEFSTNVGSQIPGFGVVGALAAAVVAALLNEASRGCSGCSRRGNCRSAPGLGSTRRTESRGSSGRAVVVEARRWICWAAGSSCRRGGRGRCLDFKCWRDRGAV